MKRFRFKLATVLKVKYRVEELRQRELRVAQGFLEGARRELIQRRQAAAETAAAYRKNLQKRLDLQLILYYQQFLSWRNEQVDLAVHAVAESERLVEAARQRLLIATRERKIIEKLKERAYQTYLAAELSEEIKFLDEIGTGRFVRQK